MGRVFAEWAYRKYGAEASCIPQWGVSEALGVPHHLEPEIWDFVWREYRYLYDGAEEFIARVPKAEIVSTRPSGPARDNFNGQFRLRVQRMTRNIHLFENWEQKERFVLREAPKALLEDNLEFLVKFPESSTRLFLMDRPWNQSADASGHYTRVRNYGEFLGLL
jgi:hypothetical protein